MKFISNVGTNNEVGRGILADYERRGYVIGAPQGVPGYSAERMEAHGTVGIYEPANVFYAQNLEAGEVLYEEAALSQWQIDQVVVGEHVVLVILSNKVNPSMAPTNKLFKYGQPVLTVAATVR